MKPKPVYLLVLFAIVASCTTLVLKLSQPVPSVVSSAASTDECRFDGTFDVVMCSCITHGVAINNNDFPVFIKTIIEVDYYDQERFRNNRTRVLVAIVKVPAHNRATSREFYFTNHRHFYVIDAVGRNLGAMKPSKIDQTGICAHL